MYIYKCIYTNVYIQMYIQMYIYKCIYTNVYIQMSIYKCIYTYTNVYIQIYIQMYIYKCIYTNSRFEVDWGLFTQMKLICLHKRLNVINFRSNLRWLIRVFCVFCFFFEPSCDILILFIRFRLGALLSDGLGGRRPGPYAQSGSGQLFDPRWLFRPLRDSRTLVWIMVIEGVIQL